MKYEPNTKFDARRIDCKTQSRTEFGTYCRALDDICMDIIICGDCPEGYTKNDLKAKEPKGL